MIAFALARYSKTSPFFYKAPDHDIYKFYLKKTVALNPSYFNAYLILYTDQLKTLAEKTEYLKKMYAIAPEQFKLHSSGKGYGVNALQNDKFKLDIYVSVSIEDWNLIHKK